MNIKPGSIVELLELGSEPLGPELRKYFTPGSQHRVISYCKKNLGGRTDRPYEWLRRTWGWCYLLPRGVQTYRGVVVGVPLGGVGC